MEALLGLWTAAGAHTIALAISFALEIFMHVVLGEQVPKTIAIRTAEETALAISRRMG